MKPSVKDVAVALRKEGVPILSDADISLALGLIGFTVKETIGRAIAAVLLDKPPDAVTQEEAFAALANPVVKGNRERTNRAIRAGLIAMAVKLEPEVIPPNSQD